MSAKQYPFLIPLLFMVCLLGACTNNVAVIPTTATPVLVPTPTLAATTPVIDSATETTTLTTTAPITIDTPVTTSVDVTVTEPVTTVVTTDPAAETATGTADLPMTTTAAITAAEVSTEVPTVASDVAGDVTGNLASAVTSDSQLGAILASQFIETVPVDQITSLSTGFYPANNLVNAQYAVDIYRLTVQSSDELGEPIDLQADLFLPRVEAERLFPVLGYAPGTTGLGDGCAPSQEYILGRQWGSYRTHMLSYAGQGFIGVLPDGMSYRNPDRPHEYFILELEAHTLLDSARAAFRFFADPPAAVGARPLDALFFAGYSNGGHTTFAAKDFAADYAPELPLRGAISHGATTNVEALMRESPIFTPYLIYAYRHFFGADVIGPEDVFLDDWLPSFDEDVLTKCVDDIFVYYTNDPQGMYRPEFRTALFNGQLADQYPVFKAVLDANYAGVFGGFDIPVAFFQGTADYVVTPESQQRFAAQLCEAGQPVTYVSLPAVQHASTRQVSFKASLAWMQGIVNGQTPQSNCAQIAAEN